LGRQGPGIELARAVPRLQGAIKGMPPVTSGGGSLIGVFSSAITIPAMLIHNNISASHLPMLGLVFKG
jgi:hypothetical protein